MSMTLSQKKCFYPGFFLFFSFLHYLLPSLLYVYVEPLLLLVLLGWETTFSLLVV